jgi:TorA maturation chaperone TorD
MNTQQAPATSSALDEEIARAEVYGLLAALYYSPPVPELLAQLRVAATEAPSAGGTLQAPWQALVQLARERTDAQVADEYNALFGGVGKPEVYLFGSHFLAGFLNEKPLAKLRTDLTKLGLSRDETMPETEDHFAYGCEVMRYLIAGDDMAVCNLTQQKNFFGDHLQPWVAHMCDAIMAHPKAQFYAALAAFTAGFVEVEQQGFDLLD